MQYLYHKMQDQDLSYFIKEVIKSVVCNRHFRLISPDFFIAIPVDIEGEYSYNKYCVKT